MVQYRDGFEKESPSSVKEIVEFMGVSHGLQSDIVAFYNKSKVYLDCVK